jgi:pilus assembly protein Flp/PilA
MALSCHAQPLPCHWFSGESKLALSSISPSRLVFGSLEARASVFVKGISEKGEEPVTRFIQNVWKDESGQDIAEYAVMLAVILVIVVGTIRLIGSNANTVFSEVGSAIQ